MENYIKECVSFILLLHPIVQQPWRYKELLDSFDDKLDYVLYDAYSDHITASESFSIINGPWYVRNSQHLENPLGC
jgi:hypothetical protein